MVDHRNSPGLDADTAHRVGFSGLPVGKGKLFEADTSTCSHCCAVVIMNPLRTRAREYCPKCDAYICDACAAVMAATGTCGNLSKLLDYVQESNARMEEQGIPILGLPDLSPLYTTVTVSMTEAPPKGE